MEDVAAVTARVSSLAQLTRADAGFAALLAQQSAQATTKNAGATTPPPGTASAGTATVIPPLGPSGPTATLGEMLSGPVPGLSWTGVTPAPPPVTAAPVGAVGAPVTETGGFIAPVDGELTSDFGNRVHPITGEHKHHDGVDFGAAHGTEIHAAAGGEVTYSGVMGGYGNVVMIKHANGLETLYAHASSLDVQVGDKVAQGQAIARVGSTGMSTGPHLHFEVQRDGEAVDPADYL